MPAAKFFPTPAGFRAWLERHASTEKELLVGFHKLGSGRPSITWPQSVDEALCFGWIDGVRKRIDDHSYQIRFSPRRPGSTWSAINIERVRGLMEHGRMTPAGLEAFAHRLERKSRTYSYEQETAAVLAPKEEAALRRNKRAWAFLQKQPRSYRQKVVWWVIDAKRPATREKRLARLIEASTNATLV
jgi:uncharacterized protein YdeI (YjbR/CyaY-like superfamily)